jgi:hypothetical protein
MKASRFAPSIKTRLYGWGLITLYGRTQPLRWASRVPGLNPASLVGETCHGLPLIESQNHLGTAWKPSPTF